MIDPEIQSFVADSLRFDPADAASRPPAEQRRLYDAYAAAFALSRPAGVSAEDGALALGSRTLPLRRYRPPGASRGRAAPRGTIVYAHGGGFTLGSLDSHDGVTARIAAACGADVVAVDYRLAPEHRCPAALDDVLAAVEAVAHGRTPWPDLASGPLALAGDSAGGLLVAGAALRLAGRIPLAVLGLVYPMLGAEPALPARDTEALAPMLTLADARACRDSYLGGALPPPGTFPLDAASLAGLPPTVLIAAEHDPLRDDAVAFAARLRADGVAAECFVGAGLVHGFLRALDRSREAGCAFDRLIAGVNRAMDGSQMPGFASPPRG